MGALPRETQDYIAHGSHEGNRNSSLFAAACQLRDAGMPLHDVEGLLIARGQMDGLTHRECEATIRSVFSAPAREPITAAPRQLTYTRPNQIRQEPQVKLRPIEPDDRQEYIPQPIAGGLRVLLQRAFRFGEHVCIAESTHGGNWKTREEWLAALDEHGCLSKLLPLGADTYVVINPVTKGRRKDPDVTAFRHLLVEFDHMPKLEQWRLIKGSNLPITAVIDSGKKSLHAWVRVDAKDADEYEARQRQVYALFDGIDEKNRNPARLTRCPDVLRIVDGEQKRQELVAVGIGLEDWQAWADWEEYRQATADLEVSTFDDLVKIDTTNDPDCLLGSRWLCRGGSAIWVGQSGIGKSAITTQAALLWAGGKSFFGIQPKRPLKSLIIQAENDRGDLAEMVQGVSKGVGFLGVDEASSIACMSNLVWVRCTAQSGAAFIAKLKALLKRHKPDMVWIDPFLSFLGGDVNDQETVSHFLRAELGPLMIETGVVVHLVHHTGKPGNAQQDKTISDWAYAGIGSSEITNWARAVNVLQRLDDETFVLRLAKRGFRAGAIDHNGFPSCEIYLAHADKGIYWQQTSKPKEGKKEQPSLLPSLQQHSWTTFAELEESTGKGRRFLHAVLGRHIDAGEVEKGPQGYRICKA